MTCIKLTCTNNVYWMSAGCATDSYFEENTCPVKPEDYTWVVTEAEEFIDWYRHEWCNFDPAKSEECNWQCSCALDVAIFMAGRGSFTIEQFVTLTKDQMTQCGSQNINTLISPPMNVRTYTLPLTVAHLWLQSARVPLCLITCS